jgi:DNA-binding transcriptional LysR family regulator
MNLDDVRALVAVKEAGSIAAAAERLNVTQPAVTRRIQRLEGSLGLALLDRSCKPAQLTPAGQAAYLRAQHIVRAADGFDRGLAANGVPEGALRLGVSYALADCVLAPALMALRQDFPKVSPYLMAESSSVLSRRVASGELDAAAIVSAHGGPDGLLSEPAGREAVVVVAPKRFGLAGAREVHELAPYDWVLNPEGCGFRRQLEAALGGADQLRLVAESWGATLQLSLVAEGIGLTLAPARLVREHARRGELDVLDFAAFRPFVRVFMVRAGPLGGLDRAISRFAQVVAASLDPGDAA